MFIRNRYILVSAEHCQVVHPKVQVPVRNPTQSQGQVIYERKRYAKVFKRVVLPPTSLISQNRLVPKENVPALSVNEKCLTQ